MAPKYFLASPHTVASLTSGLSQPMIFIGHQLNSSQLVRRLTGTSFFFKKRNKRGLHPTGQLK
jgi:hypothetical protein